MKNNIELNNGKIINLPARFFKASELKSMENNNCKISAMDWVKKDFITPIELQMLKGENANKAIILGEIRIVEHDKWTDRLMSIQLSSNKKIRWLKLRHAVIAELMRAFGEYLDDWRGKEVSLLVGEERGYEVINVYVGLKSGVDKRDIKNKECNNNGI